MDVPVCFNRIVELKSQKGGRLTLSWLSGSANWAVCSGRVLVDVRVNVKTSSILLAVIFTTKLYSFPF